jgi:septal ring factor EnvC (AmiA/AmiB activator)
MRTFALAILLGAALGADTAQRVNPVQKVTQLLAKLQTEIEEEGTKEAAAYDKYACFCKEHAASKQYAIEKFVAKENLLNAKIDDKTARKAALDGEIATHKTDIEKLEGDQQTAADERSVEHEAYTTRNAQLTKAIAAMEGAINALQASKGQMENAKAGYTGLLHKYKNVIKNSVALAESLGIVHSGGALLKLLQSEPDTSHAYTYHSNEIVSTLQSLLKNFKQKRTQADMDEQSGRQEHEMQAGARRNQMNALEKSKAEKTAASAELEEELNAHSSKLQETEDAHAADQAFLNDLTAKCEQKAADWDSRSSTRTQELTAIAKALELLKGDVSANYGATDLGLVSKKAKKPSLVAKASKPGKTAPPAEKGGHWEWIPDAPAAQVQTEAKKADTEDSDSDSDSDDDDEDEDSDEEPVSFLQLKDPKNAAARKKVLGFLASKATALKSTALTTLLVKLRDAPSPFAKVKQMISDLVDRLEAEADAEADQKSWCDEQMKETTAERDESQRKIEDYNALHTEKSALVDSLGEQIADLAAQIADLQKALSEETTLREKESANNKLTVDDATAGKAAVEQAIQVLSNFYGFLQQAPVNAAEGYERFAAEGAGADGQTVDDLAPDSGGVEGEYGGKGDAAKSIITLLEQIQEDFDSTVTATNAAESKAAGEYDKFKTDTETDISDKGDLKVSTEADRTQAELDITQAEADLKSEKALLQAALDELEKLKPVCVDSGMSWEERSARRNQEIESLKEALKILQNTDFGF